MEARIQVAGLSVLEDGWALGWDGVKLGVVDKGGEGGCGGVVAMVEGRSDMQEDFVHVCVHVCGVPCRWGRGPPFEDQPALHSRAHSMQY